MVLLVAQDGQQSVPTLAFRLFRKFLLWPLASVNSDGIRNNSAVP